MGAATIEADQLACSRRNARRARCAHDLGHGSSIASRLAREHRRDLALRAARRLAAWRAWLGELEVHILWVQQPLTYLETVMPPHDDVVGQWSRKDGDKATRAVVALLRREGIARRVHFSVGDPALEARSLVEDTGAELVALGTRGLGAAHHALVGSVALKAAVACPVPALLVP